MFARYLKKIFFKIILLLLSLNVQASTSVVDYLLSSQNEWEMEKRCLAANVYFESRNEPLESQWAVANVTIQRVLDNRWPGTICKVVFQKNQFSWVNLQSPKIKSKKNWKLAEDIAEAILSGDDYIDVTNGATNYYAYYIKKPLWAESLTEIGQIGAHIFYK